MRQYFFLYSCFPRYSKLKIPWAISFQPSLVYHLFLNTPCAFTCICIVYNYFHMEQNSCERPLGPVKVKAFTT